MAHMALGLTAALVVLDPALRYQWDKWYTLPIAAIGNMGVLIACWAVLRAVGSGLLRSARRPSALVRPARKAEAEPILP
jgi:hypothetical protein